MVAGGVLFGWNWLWGDADLLQPRTGVLYVAAGALCMVASYFLSRELSLGITEFLDLASTANRRARWLYRLPTVGTSLMIYGALIISRQSSAD
jgi:hypothetical protein